MRNILAGICVMALCGQIAQAQGTSHGSDSFLKHVPLKGAPNITVGALFDDDWARFAAASDRFTTQLQQRFPPGSSEQQMTQTLLAQGFKHPPMPKPGCIKKEDVSKMPVGKAFVPCPLYDPNHALVFEWHPQQLPVQLQAYCIQSVFVSWQPQDGKVMAVRGYYDGYCP